MERALAEVVRRASDDIAFHVLSVELEDDLQPLVSWTPVRLPLRPAPVLIASFWIAAAAAARDIPADLTHTMGAIAPVHADLASVQFCHAAFQALPRVEGERSASLPRRASNTLTRTFALKAERWCYRPARTRMFAPASAGVQAELRRFYPSIPSVVIPNAADHERFHPNALVRATTRATLRVADDTTVVLFCGSDWQRKGLEFAIEGVAKARSAGNASVVLWVVGSGDVERYRAYAQSLDGSSWCSFHGFSREPERFLAAADVFVSPTLYEAFPLAVLEAAACGLPVVATDVNGVAELIRNGREGIVVSRNGASVAAAITTLVRDAALRARMGSAALESARRYTWDAVAQTTLAAYGSLLHSSSL